MVLRVESSVDLCSFFMGLSLILELFVCELDRLLYSWDFLPPIISYLFIRELLNMFFLLMFMCLFNGRDWMELNNPIEDRNCRRVRRIWLTEVKNAFRRIKMKSHGTRWNPLWSLEVLKRGRCVLVPGWQIFLKSLVCLVSKLEVHLTPIYKKEGDIQNYTNCCGSKLIIHTMKLWERVIEHRLIHETTIS